MANSSFMKHLLLICIVFAGCHSNIRMTTSPKEFNVRDYNWDLDSVFRVCYDSGGGRIFIPQGPTILYEWYIGDVLKVDTLNSRALDSFRKLGKVPQKLNPLFELGRAIQVDSIIMDTGMYYFGANNNDGCENDGPALYRTLDSIAKDSVEIREGDFNIEPGTYERFGLRLTNCFNSMDSGNFSGRQFDILDSTIHIYSDTLDDIKGYWYDFDTPTLNDTLGFYIGDGDKSHIVYKSHVVHTSYLIDDSTGRRVTDSGGRMYIDTIKRPIGHPAIFDEH